MNLITINVDLYKLAGVKAAILHTWLMERQQEASEFVDIQGLKFFPIELDNWQAPCPVTGIGCCANSARALFEMDILNYAFQGPERKLIVNVKQFTGNQYD